MSVCVLGQAGADSWSARSAAAIEASGSMAHRAVAAAEEVPADVRVVLASSAAPPATIAAVFSTVRAQAWRKIVTIEQPAEPSLFAIADMLVFPAAGLMDMLGVDRWPGDPSALAALQALLKRHNQAVVVRLPGNAASAVWADRTLEVAGPEGDDDDATMARFGGTIAAAVDQGIGPERALAMALAAAVR
jgi:hypothetical protein